MLLYVENVERVRVEKMEVVCWKQCVAGVDDEMVRRFFYCGKKKKVNNYLKERIESMCGFCCVYVCLYMQCWLVKV